MRVPANQRIYGMTVEGTDQAQRMAIAGPPNRIRGMVVSNRHQENCVMVQWENGPRERWHLSLLKRPNKTAQ